MQSNYKGLDYTTYIVKQGDSLFTIGKLFNTTPEKIKIYNNLGSDLIYPNQIIFIPMNNSTRYQTVEGDTLKTVFRKLNLDTTSLKNYEQMLDVLLVPNQLIELVDVKTNHKNALYMGESIEEFLVNNEINAIDLLKSNKNNWLPVGSRVKIG